MLYGRMTYLLNRGARSVVRVAMIATWWCCMWLSPAQAAVPTSTQFHDTIVKALSSTNSTVSRATLFGPDLPKPVFHVTGALEVPAMSALQALYVHAEDLTERHDLAVQLATLLLEHLRVPLAIAPSEELTVFASSGSSGTVSLRADRYIAGYVVAFAPIAINVASDGKISKIHGVYVRDHEAIAALVSGHLIDEARARRIVKEDLLAIANPIYFTKNPEFFVYAARSIVTEPSLRAIWTVKVISCIYQIDASTGEILERLHIDPYR